MTLTSDTLLGLAWYTFATCCSRPVLFPLLFKLWTHSYGLYNCFTKFGFVIMSWTGCNHYWACVVKHVVVISLDSPSCRVCLFDLRTGGCIRTLPDRSRFVPFEVRLSRCCLYGDGQRTWAGIIQLVLPQLVSELQVYTIGVGILKIDFRIKFDQQGISKNYVGFIMGYA